MIRAALITALMATSVQAETIIAARTIRAGSIVMADDLKQSEHTVPGMVTQAVLIVGKEARTNLFAGRPIRAADLRAPTIVERNQVLPLIFETNGLRIVTEGRALDRGGVGDHLRVMNLSSRNTVFGRVDASGAVLVGQ